jgi:hypothetical protein
MQMNKGVRYIDVSDFNWDNPHAIVSLLKCFLNELPDSIITTGKWFDRIHQVIFLYDLIRWFSVFLLCFKALYNEFIQYCRIEHHHLRLMSIKKLMRQMPINNYETLKYLSAHLRRVAGAHQHNKVRLGDSILSVSNVCFDSNHNVI